MNYDAALEIADQTLRLIAPHCYRAEEAGQPGASRGPGGSWHLSRRDHYGRPCRRGAGQTGSAAAVEHGDSEAYPLPGTVRIQKGGRIHFQICQPPDRPDSGERVADAG